MTAIRPRSILGPVAAVVALAAGAAQAAEITIFKQPNFTGGKLTVQDEVKDLAGSGFNDQTSSVVVRSGRWQLCSQPNFGGDCVVLERGEYPQLGVNINHRVESARDLTRVAANEGYRERGYAERGYGERAYDEPGFRRRYGAASVELFPGPDFRGESVWLDRDVARLNERLLERGVSSIVVHHGRWQACTRPGFEGRCEVLEPGSYADLGRLDNRIGSLRRVG